MSEKKNDDHIRFNITGFDTSLIRYYYSPFFSRSLAGEELGYFIGSVWLIRFHNFPNQNKS